MMLSVVLQHLYDSEINFTVSSFWDGGMVFALGDEMNGWQEKETFWSASEGTDWLTKTARRIFPDSEFAKWFDGMNAQQARACGEDDDAA